MGTISAWHSFFVLLSIFFFCLLANIALNCNVLLCRCCNVHESSWFWYIIKCFCNDIVNHKILVKISLLSRVIIIARRTNIASRSLFRYLIIADILSFSISCNDWGASGTRDAIAQRQSEIKILFQAKFPWKHRRCLCRRYNVAPPILNRPCTYNI